MTDHIKVYGVKPRIQYVANGTSTVYEFPFVIFDTSDVDVYLNDTKQASTSFTVSGVRDSDGGTVTFATAPASGTVISIIRNLSIERTSDFQEGGALRADVLNDELDYQIACQQQIAENLNRSMVLPPYAVDSGVNLTLPTPAAGKAIVWNSDGTNLENSTVPVNALESTLKGYKESAENAASTATTKAGIASDKADIATTQAQTATTQAGIATTKAAEAAAAVSSKANKDMDNLSNAGKSALIALGMPDLSRQTTLSVTTTPQQAPYNMFVTMVLSAGGYLFVNKESTYLADDSTRRAGVVNTAANVFIAMSTVIAKGEWYYTNTSLHAVYACPFKGE